MPSPHPSFPAFYAALRGGGLFHPWQGDVLRAAAPRWVSQPYRLTGAGSLLAGGRFNPPKLFPAVCFSTSRDTLDAEAKAWADRYNVKVADLQAQTRFTARLEFQTMLDLTAPATLAALNLTAADLTGCPWKSEQDASREALTQAVGRAAFECMAEGLVVPSARCPGGVNVVIFPSHRRDGSRVLVKEPDEIPFMHGL